MTVGSSAWNGLGMGIFGEYNLTQQTAATDILTITGASGMAADFLVLRNSSGSEILAIRQDGFFDLNATTTVSAFAMDVRQTASSTTGWNCAGNFALTMTAVSNSSAQIYGLRAAVDASCLTTVGGGRLAALLVYMLSDSSATGASRSMIHFDDGGTNVSNWLTFGNCTLDDGCFVTRTEAASTKGLRIMHGTDTYYIMVTSCTS